MTRVGIIPIRDFHGMTRLGAVYDASARSAVAKRLATRAIGAVVDAGCAPAVLTADDAVRTWASSLDVTVWEDRGADLSTAVAAAVKDLDTWLVLHADLPLVTGDAVARVTDAAETSLAIAPSLDGGTNAIAGSGPEMFRFGPGSFTHHLSRNPDATVVIDRRLALELDTPLHATALRTIGALSSLGV